MTTKLYQDKSYFVGAKIIDSEHDPEDNQLKYKVRLGNGNIISLTKAEAFKYIPKQMVLFIEYGNKYPYNKSPKEKNSTSEDSQSTPSQNSEPQKQQQSSKLL